MDFPLTIKQTHDGLKKKKFYSIELVEEYLKRIATYDKQINSFITITPDFARQKARFCDHLIAELGEEAFKKYPLLGVVYSLKDLYLTKGIKTTAASNVLRNYVPVYSSTVFERLDTAGGVLIGKNNCDAWAHGSSGENSDFGPSKNPWNNDYVPGGSSSGSAAAVAAGFCVFSMGTDTCGSVRLPASYCGVVGLKPTYGRVSRYGVVAMASSLDCMGAIARSQEDVQKVFDIVKGIDGFDSTLKEKDDVKIGGKVTLGIPKEFFTDGLDNEVKKSVTASIEFFKVSGFDTKEVELPHTKNAIDTYYIIQPAEVSSNLARYDGIRYAGSRSHFGQEAKRRIMLGTHVLSSGYYDAYYLKAMKVRSVLISEVQKVFESVDALIAPISPTPPFRLGEKTFDPLKMYLTDVFAATANLTGIPSIAIPSGFTDDGLPLGFQIMGNLFSENILFELAKKYQNSTNWHLQTPNL